MASLVMEFMDDWLDENLHPTGYPGDDVPDPEAQLLADQCMGAAKLDGITRAQLEDEYGDLAVFMHRRLVAAAEAEVQRQVEKDD
jgi:hypothetical protein